MKQPKFKTGDRVRYVGGMIRYNGKFGEVSKVIIDRDKYYYHTTFTIEVAGSCAECEIKKY